MLSRDEQIAWHSSQYTESKRSVAALRAFVTGVMSGDEPPTEVLDAATGGGANMLHMADLFPDAHWTGVDLEEDLVSIGREQLDPARFTMVQGDLSSLEDDFGPKRFDVCFSIMTLSWLEAYERAVQQMLAVTTQWLFVLNLFSDSHLDADIQVVGRMPGPHQGLRSYYNVYSLPRFREFCKQQGARQIITEPFEIDVDLPRPDHGGMGTWTERTADGRRLQLSGPLLMPWRFVAVRM